MKKCRIGIVGAGAVGSTTALNAALSGVVDEILLMDIRKEKAEAEAMDLRHAITFQSRYCAICAGDYSQCGSLDLIIITAAAPLVQGQTRLDMLETAKKITASIVPPIMDSGFRGQFLVITNPVDIISYYVYKLSGLPSNHVIGTGNALDSARLRTMLSTLCGVNVESIQAYSVGEHGDSQFIPWSTVSIGGKAFGDILADEKKIAEKFDPEQMLFDVKDAGWKIARVKNTTNFGIAATAVRIMKAILYDENIVLPVSHIWTVHMDRMGSISACRPCWARMGYAIWFICISMTRSRSSLIFLRKWSKSTFRRCDKSQRQKRKAIHMERYLLSGNEAIARGAYEAGVKVCSAYPGTPSTEIFENLPKYKDALYCEWAPNEKVATEVAYGASIAGVRSLCAMKYVGVNVAADPIFTAAYNGVNGGFVIVSADDPSMHSSQNEQDNRNYARAAKLAMLEPSDSQECLSFMKAAYGISEQFDLPVLFRTTTRVAHSKSLVETGEREEHPVPAYARNARKNIASPANAMLNHPKLEDALAALEEYGCTSPLNRMEINGDKIGVITASIAYQYAKDAFPADTSFLKLGLTNPLPMRLIREFASKVEKLYIIEELDGFMEEQIKAAGIDCVGKELTGRLYELNPQLLRERIFGEKPETVDVGVQAVSRPPALCPGCPHRGFFYTMSRHKDFVIAGDIGCYTLGGSAPLDAIDSVVCMGGGFTVAMGMSRAFEMGGQTDKKVFGVMGDSTFFHSGMTGAAEIIYNHGNVIPVVLDNSITGMTGHQENPGSGYTLQGDIAESLKIEDILAAYGYKTILIVDPQDLAAMEKAVQDALASTEPAAIITRRPCLLIKRIKHDIGKCEVDQDKCIGCKKCLSVGCPAVMVEDKKAKIDPNQCVGCTVCAQVCPKSAIARKEN